MQACLLGWSCARSSTVGCRLQLLISFDLPAPLAPVQKCVWQCTSGMRIKIRPEVHHLTLSCTGAEGANKSNKPSVKKKTAGCLFRMPGLQHVLFWHALWLHVHSRNTCRFGEERPRNSPGKLRLTAVAVRGSADVEVWYSQLRAPSPMLLLWGPFQRTSVPRTEWEILEAFRNQHVSDPRRKFTNQITVNNLMFTNFTT